MEVRKVVHFGPSESRGGMSAVIRSLISSTPENWEAGVVNTHSEGGLLAKFIAFRRASNQLDRMVNDSNIDIGHVHVTHGFSWWRKLRIIKKLEKNAVPIIIHIHSGKFERFCSGLAGNSVRRNLRKGGRRVVLLEERWRKLLKNWIPKDSLVIQNSSNPQISRKSDNIGGRIKLLHLSRDSPGKGHDFSIRVLEELLAIGVDACLIMTGRTAKEEFTQKLPVEQLGWVSDEERDRLLGEADFLLSPSEFEGSSMSIIESMVAGLPVLVSEASAETVGDDRCVLDLGEPRRWAKKIKEFSRPENYASLVSSVRKQARRFHTNDTSIKWGAAYNSLMKSNNSN